MSWSDPALSVLLGGAYLGLLSLVWLLLALGVPAWGRRQALPEPPGSAAVEPGEAAAPGPRVSVCVPARDEAENIGACVEALRALRWPDLEILVVDDRSSDDTAARAREAAAGDPRVRIIAGTDPPRGWAGKPWACFRAAGEATGALLLFVDADVRVHPALLDAAVPALLRSGAGMLSLFGTWELHGFWERLLIPAVGWTIRGAIDLDRVNDPGQEDAFANGQLILVKREAYEAVSGHEAVRDSVLEDVGLARAFKQAGHGVALRVAPWAFRVRLYRGLREILRGYGKNLYEGMGRRPALALGSALFLFVGSVLPYLALLGSVLAFLVDRWIILTPWWLAWLALVCALQTVFRWRLEARDGRPGAIALLHPVASVLLMAILLGSVAGLRAEWKGRRFVDGRAVEG